MDHIISAGDFLRSWESNSSPTKRSNVSGVGVSFCIFMAARYFALSSPGMMMSGSRTSSGYSSSLESDGNIPGPERFYVHEAIVKVCGKFHGQYVVNVT